ncbi:MAG TPA: EAL domain-containing protein [Abditibacterium sp.]|jgi:diguanylate cyclase (GGDEF)-like protein/PAS domain S-box-containing protein
MNPQDLPCALIASESDPSGQNQSSANERDALETELGVLMQIARTLNSGYDLNELLGKVAVLLRPYLPLDHFFITLIEGEGESLVLRQEASDNWDLPPFTSLKRGDYPSHPVWDVIKNDKMCSESSLQPLMPNGEPAEGRQLRAYINVPLWFEQHVAGVLHFDSYAAVQWSPAQLRLAQLVGEQFAAKVQSVRDLHQRQAQENELAQSNALLRATQEAAAEGICLVNDAGELVSYNRRFARLWQFEDDEAELLDVGQVMAHVTSKLADPDEFLVKITEMFEARDASARDETRLADGRIFERYSAPAISSDGRSFGRVWTFSDITERKNYEEKLTHQAFHDAVTGLPNRVLFTDHLRHALTKLERTKNSVAVLFLDLDRFKVVNDSLGHEKGDQLLVQVARRLRQSLRPGDIAARFGGDEFVVLLEEVVTPDDATRIADRIAANLRTPFELGDHEVNVTASIGIVISSSGEEGADDLLRKADVAMYRAKHKGKAQYEVFSEQLSGEALDRLQLELDLTTAVKRGELEVWYQPLVDLPNGQIRSFEALVRWNHPQRGMVSPAQFIPVAEETGLIVSIDAYVLRVACAQAKAWSDEGGEPVHIHVNLSVRGFEQANLPAQIARILHEVGLEASQLMLEITESAVMTDAKSAIAQLKELKKLGVSISIDDFGTGHSSLAYLEFFPIDLLKIDRAFVARLAEGTTLVRAIASLGHALGMEVAAEGIETSEQMTQLRAMGIRWGQGFLISRPVPAPQAEKLMSLTF